jgi:hypothetical protein
MSTAAESLLLHRVYECYDNGAIIPVAPKPALRGAEVYAVLNEGRIDFTYDTMADRCTTHNLRNLKDTIILGIIEGSGADPLSADRCMDLMGYLAYEPNLGRPLEPFYEPLFLTDKGTFQLRKGYLEDPSKYELVERRTGQKYLTEAGIFLQKVKGRIVD